MAQLNRRSFVSRVSGVLVLTGGGGALARTAAAQGEVCTDLDVTSAHNVGDPVGRGSRRAGSICGRERIPLPPPAPRVSPNSLDPCANATDAMTQLRCAAANQNRFDGPVEGAGVPFPFVQTPSGAVIAPPPNPAFANNPRYVSAYNDYQHAISRWVAASNRVTQLNNTIANPQSTPAQKTAARAQLSDDSSGRPGAARNLTFARDDAVAKHATLVSVVNLSHHSASEVFAPTPPAQRSTPPHTP